MIAFLIITAILLVFLDRLSLLVERSDPGPRVLSDAEIEEEFTSHESH